MTDWYYHDPIEGRVGPLPADDLRTRYGERRIQLDTLVWHHGLREWSALERQAEALDLYSITPDTSQPPPLPRAVPPLPPPSSASYGMAGTRHAPPPKKGMSGCLIAVLVAAALSVPLIAILAAIAIPAYQDYVARSAITTALVQAVPIKASIESVMAAGDTADSACPDNDQAGLGAPDSYASAKVANIEIGTFETGQCGIAISLRGSPKLQGKHLWLERDFAESGSAWVCTSDLDNRWLPATCRAP